jgi:hypothetical protein
LEEDMPSPVTANMNAAEIFMSVIPPKKEQFFNKEQCSTILSCFYLIIENAYSTGAHFIVKTNILQDLFHSYSGILS